MSTLATVPVRINVFDFSLAPWFIYGDEGDASTLQGYVKDVVDLLAYRMGFQVEYVPFSPTGIMDGRKTCVETYSERLLSGHADMASIYLDTPVLMKPGIISAEAYELDDFAVLNV